MFPIDEGLLLLLRVAFCKSYLENLYSLFFLQKKGVKTLFSLSFVGKQKKVGSGTGKASATIQKVRCGKVNNPVLFQFSLKSGETRHPIFGILIATLDFISPAL